MNASITYQPRLVFWLSVAQLITWGSVFYGFALLMEPVERELGLTRAQSSLAFSLALLAEGLLAFPIGRWIDRGHERAVMTGGSLLIALCLMLHSMIDSALTFYAVWIGLGAALSATLYTPAFAVVTRRFPVDFRRAIITLTFLGGLASTVFIPVCNWLIHEFGWRHALWWLAALHLLITAPLHAVVLVNAPRTDIDVMNATAAQLDLAQHLRSKPFLLVAGFIICMMAATSALPAHLVSILREQHLPESWVIAIPASIGAVQVLGRVLLFFFEKHFDVDLANRLIPCLIPLGLALLLVAPAFDDAHFWTVIAFVLLYGLGNGMITIVKGTAIAQYIDRTHVASLNGALGIPVALARAASPLMLGVLWSREAGYSHGLLVLVLLSLLGIASLIGAQKLRRRLTAH